MDVKADYLFEASWEVCNKIGGIYTVVKSKASKIIEYYNENYYLIGPYFAEKALSEFQEGLPEENIKKIFNELNKEGIICHYGRWLIKGNPKVILIDFENFKNKINDIKKDLWDSFKIDSLRAPFDYNDPVVWAYAVGKLIWELNNSFKNKRIVAQFHEWLSGCALLYLKKNKARIASVFTTHATVLGRTLTNSNIDLYNVWDKIEPDKESYKYFVESKHMVEKQSALNADVFTTVSEITGIEAEHLLGRKPDILLPNGLDIDRFPTFEEISIKHKLQRSRIREFLLYYFFPYYTFNIDETMFYFIAGRYEFHDKGIDIFINSLGRLNEKLKREKSKKTIVAFIWVPANIRGIKTELLENKTLYEDIRDKLDEDMDDVKKRIIYSIVSRKKINEKLLFEQDFLDEVKRKLMKIARKGKPPLSTHDLMDQNDIILRSLERSALNNDKNDPVKVVYYPIYLSGADGLLNLSYYEAMQGSHLGVFPSYYEPWGYTPLETGALGVSSVTTDLAGFGRFFCKECQQGKTPGIFVIERMNKSDDQVIEKLSGIMFNFANLPKQDRISNKIHARQAASLADWKLFIENYIKAHNLGIEKIF